MPLETTPTDAAEIPMNCSMLETQHTHLSREEHDLLKELLRPGASIEAVIPADATGDEMWRTLDACVRGLKLLEARMLRLKPIVGRILLMFENKPSLYKDLGYDTFSDFMRRGVYERLGMHHTSAYESRMVAKKFPQIGPDRYARIGTKNINTLSKFTDGKSPNAELWLETAEKMRPREFIQYVEQRGILQKGESVGATLVINTNRAIYEHAKEFFSDGRVIAKVGSRDWGEILEALIQEASVEWEIEGIAIGGK